MDIVDLVQNIGHAVGPVLHKGRCGIRIAAAVQRATDELALALPDPVAQPHRIGKRAVGAGMEDAASPQGGEEREAGRNGKRSSAEGVACPRLGEDLRYGAPSGGMLRAGRIYRASQDPGLRQRNDWIDRAEHSGP